MWLDKLARLHMYTLEPQYNNSEISSIQTRISTKLRASKVSVSTSVVVFSSS